MKITVPKFTAFILRWNAKAQKHIAQQLNVSSMTGFHICSQSDHRYCSHSPETIILRGTEVTGINFYPSLNKLHIFVSKPEEE